MATYSYTFDEVKRRATKNLPCPTCGKKVRRSTTFMQTVNPYNKLPNGDIKHPVHIRTELAAEAAVWVTKPVICSKCTVQVPRTPDGTY